MTWMNAARPLPLGFSKDINYTFANAEFLSNCLDYCVNPSGILEARSKDFSLRLLDPEKTEDGTEFLAIHQHWPAFIGYSVMWPDFSIYQEEKIQYRYIK